MILNFCSKTLRISMVQLSTYAGHLTWIWFTQSPTSSPSSVRNETHCSVNLLSLFAISKAKLFSNNSQLVSLKWSRIQVVKTQQSSWLRLPTRRLAKNLLKVLSRLDREAWVLDSKSKQCIGKNMVQPRLTTAKNVRHLRSAGANLGPVISEEKMEMLV